MSCIPNTDTDRSEMLATIGVPSLDALFDQTPKPQQLQGPLNIPPRLDPISLMWHLSSLARKNVYAADFPCFLGAGIYGHYTPPTVAAITGRSEFYTSYTLYQPEVIRITPIYRSLTTPRAPDSIHLGPVP